MESEDTDCVRGQLEHVLAVELRPAMPLLIEVLELSVRVELESLEFDSCSLSAFDNLCSAADSCSDPAVSLWN